MGDTIITHEPLVTNKDDIERTPTKAVNGRNLSRQIVAAIITTSLHIVCGCCLAYSAILVPQLMEEQVNANQTNGTISPDKILWITSSPVIVIPVSCVLAGFTMDVVGRLNALKLSAIPNIIGWGLIAVAQNINMIIIGRLCTGLAFGFACNAALVYVTEISDSHIRGVLLNMSGIGIAIGVALTYFKGWLMHWRWVSWISLTYSIIPVILIMFLPESTPWLNSKGRTAAAEKSLQWFRKSKQKSEKNLLANVPMNALMDQDLKLQQSHKITLKLFLQPTAYKPYLILMTFFAFQQFSGIYMLTFNSVIFFKSVRVNLDPYQISACIGIVRLIVYVINIWLTNTFGRRHLVLASSTGMGFSMIVSALYTKWLQDGSTTNFWVPVCMVTLYFAFAAIGMQSTPFTMTPELYPLRIRGVMQSLTYSGAYVLLFVSLHSYNFLCDTFHGASGLQYFFAVVSFGVCVFTYVFLPETFNKTLSDIENYFWHRSVYI